MPLTARSRRGSATRRSCGSRPTNASAGPPEPLPGCCSSHRSGRSFQDEYPDVTPLLDHGRHLVISAADKPRRRSNHCWRIEPLRAGTRVIDTPPVVPARADPAVAQLVADVSRRRTRRPDLAGGPADQAFAEYDVHQAMDFADARMVALGYRISRTPITVGAGHSGNLIGDRAGIGSGPRGLVVITAHLDSINLAGGPGAERAWSRRQRRAGRPGYWSSGGCWRADRGSTTYG